MERLKINLPTTKIHEKRNHSSWTRNECCSFGSKSNRIYGKKTSRENLIRCSCCYQRILRTYFSEKKTNLLIKPSEKAWRTSDPDRTMSGSKLNVIIEALNVKFEARIHFSSEHRGDCCATLTSAGSLPSLHPPLVISHWKIFIQKFKLFNNLWWIKCFSSCFIFWLNVIFCSSAWLTWMERGWWRWWCSGWKWKCFCVVEMLSRFRAGSRSAAEYSVFLLIRSFSVFCSCV